MGKFSFFSSIPLLFALAFDGCAPQTDASSATAQTITPAQSEDSKARALPPPQSGEVSPPINTPPELPTPNGIEPAENYCLGARSDLLKTWFGVRNDPSQGHFLRLALRLAEASRDGIDIAVRIIENIEARNETSDDRDDFGDIYSYHLARLFEAKAQALETEQNSSASKQTESDADSDANAAENERLRMLKKARARYDRAAQRRLSPYYHAARAKSLAIGIQTGDADAGALSEFIETYPDYPGLSAFRFELARMQYDKSQTILSETESDSGGGKTAKSNSDADRLRAEAISVMQDLAFWNPKDPVSARAAQWLSDRGIDAAERSRGDIFKRVDNLRKIRFWDEAEDAAADALRQFPDDAPLRVQSGRIAYERSDHATAAKRFEDLFDFLGGETIDKVRPNGVRGYIMRAYAYMGDCGKALDLFGDYAATYGKKAKLEAKRDFALACGAIDRAYDYAKQAGIGDSAAARADFAFLAYLAGDFDAARRYYAAATGGLTGNAKRRASYFLAQATLKAAQAQAKTSSDAQTPASDASSGASNAPARSQTEKKQKKSSKKKQKQSSPDQLILVQASAEAAKSMFRSIIAENADDYYAILAWSRLDELSDNPTSETIVIDDPDAHRERNVKKIRPNEDEYTFDERRLLDRFAEDAEKYASAIPELRRVKFLHDAELYRERNALFRRIAAEVMGITRLPKCPTVKNLWTAKLSIDGHLVDNRKNAAGVWGIKTDRYYFDVPDQKHAAERRKIFERQAAICAFGAPLRDFVRQTLIAFHDYYLARRYAAAPKKTCGSPDNREACAIFYPHAYSEAVINAARKNNIHPELIWTVMNIESAFNPDSISHADAYGLLQIIPMTGHKIADALGIAGFGPYDLIKPETSIEMGTWYFAQILRKFRGYAALSMAAYNGGPHQVARWLTAYSGKIEHDAFVELIPYGEARNYVKKGMSRLLIFERIDRGDPKAFFAIPNTLPASFGDMPNY